MKRLVLHTAVLVTIAMCGCSGVRNLAPAQVEMPSAFAPGTATTDTMSIADIKWYEFYGDTTLCNIIARTLDNNRDIRIAAASVDRMAAMYGIDRAAMLPELGAVVSGDREWTDYGGRGMSGDNEFSLKATVSWEINLWGAQSWAKKRGEANYMASFEDYRAMQMSLTAAAATAYFNLVALENELSIVRETLHTRAEALEQARIRYEGGLTPETVFQQARVEYSSTAALIPDLERRIAIARNALTLLMGDYPGNLPKRDLTRLYPGALPTNIVTGIPADLLQRRPDLRAAEQRLKAAMAAVGVDYANRFPSFRLSASGGFENDELGNFLKSPYSYIFGGITGPIFDFGKRKKKYHAAVAEYEQARLAYEKAVIEAFTEVNSAMSTFTRYREAYELKVTLRDAAWKYVKLARLQYLAGSLNYINVLDAQRLYFDAQVGVSNALRDEYIALVNLYKALGGGWTPTDMAKH